MASDGADGINGMTKVMSGRSNWNGSLAGQCHDSRIADGAVCARDMLVGLLAGTTKAREWMCGKRRGIVSFTLHFDP